MFDCVFISLLNNFVYFKWLKYCLYIKNIVFLCRNKIIVKISLVFNNFKINIVLMSFIDVFLDIVNFIIKEIL